MPGIFIRLKARTFVGPLEQRVLQVEISNSQNMFCITGNIFGLILKYKMAAVGLSLSVMKSAYNWLIIGRKGLGW